MLPVFAYWNGTDSIYEQKFRDSWSKAFEQFTIYSLNNVIAIAEKNFPEYASMIGDIAIPAAQSDVCRFIMLYEHGGLYIDCHFGFSDAHAVRQFREDAHHHGMIVVDNKLWRDRRSEKQIMLINGFLFAQPKHPLILACLLRMFRNLEIKRDDEARHGWKEYDIWSLTGPWILNAELFKDIGTSPPAAVGSIIPVLKDQYEASVKIVREEDLPVQRNIHGSYNKPGLHWSERQKHECLFHASGSSSMN